MPTGYTAAIKDGISFEEYAWGCARAFGALVMMRDEPGDAQIPERFEPSDYSTKALAEAEARLTRAKLLTPEQAEIEAKAAFDAETLRHVQVLADRLELRNKYNAMLTRVAQWQPPTDEHVKFKGFMVSQIRESIGFDCDEKYYRDHPPVRLSGKEWLEAEIAEAAREIAYHSKSYGEEVERTEKRNNWISALRRSLSTPSAERSTSHG